MSFIVGDYVTRNSYNNDVVFKITSINGELAFLKGIQVRLWADALLTDLQKYQFDEREADDTFFDDLDVRSEYFYLPGKILHIDADEDYLNRCLKFYKKRHLKAIGKKLNEEEMPSKVRALLERYRPDIVIITGHDAYYSKKGSIKDTNNYRNTKYFIEAVREARKFEKSHDKLAIIAGACQSNYEELIKAGANFASSPKRINIHALDPAIIASILATSEHNKTVDVLDVLSKTKYGSDGMGGLVCNGMMYVGFPR